MQREEVGRYLNVGAIGVLSVVCGFLFIQLQAVTLKVASEQRQIDDLKEQIESSANEIEQQVSKQQDLTIVNIAGTFTLLSCLVTMFHMTAHLRKMNQPFVQRKIMAILWMSPVYALTSFLSLVLPPSGEPYLGILKDFYESYVIYQFLSFLIAVLGRGDRATVVRKLSQHADHLKRPYRCLNCLFHPHPEDSDEAMANAVLLECQVLAMQFVFFRPATAIVSFIFEAVGAGDSQSQWAYFYSPQFFVMMIENVSVFLAFSGLLKFYHAVRDDLAWCQPFAKFMTIKGVVFMTFWQGLAINIIFHASESKSGNASSDDDDSTLNSSSNGYSASSIQHILICMEMLFFSAAHWCVFPAEEWEDGYKVKFFEGPGFGFKDFKDDVNLIIDSGKRSMQARREKKSEMCDVYAAEESNERKDSYESMDEVVSSGEELQGNGSFV
ncbi:hypothetical protein ACHAXR_007213 [Thalassiosira sp. AJA248-18]